MSLPALRDLIDQHFNDEELRQLCFDLDIDAENLPGDTRIAKAQSLVAHCLRHNRLPQLGEKCRELRPAVEWPDTTTLAAEWQNTQKAQEFLQDAFSGDELAAMLAPLRQKETAILTQLIGGDQVGGDKITTGDMTNSITAVGRNAQVHISGNIYYGKPADNPQEALRIYREVLAAGSRALPLRGVDVGVSDPASGQNALELAHVYIDLDTTTQVEQPQNKRQEKTVPLSALQAAVTNRRLVILGDPGGGKTTFVRHVAHCLAAHALHPDAGWLENLSGWTPGRSQYAARDCHSA